MNKQEYLEEILESGKEWIDDYFYGSFDPSDEFSDIYDDMQMVITGNDNGSFYCSSAKAREAISDAMWDEEVVDLIRELGYDGIPTDKGPEAVDVMIRYALVGEIYSDLEEYFYDSKPSIEIIMDDIDYYISKDVQPGVATLEQWHEKLERIQEIYDVK